MISGGVLIRKHCSVLENGSDERLSRAMPGALEISPLSQLYIFDVLRVLDDRFELALNINAKPIIKTRENEDLHGLWPSIHLA